MNLQQSLSLAKYIHIKRLSVYVFINFFYNILHYNFCYINMEERQPLLDIEIYLQINPVDDHYFQLHPRITLPQESNHKLLRQSYLIFVIELRTGIKVEDLAKIRNYFLGICEDVIENDLRGISFIINGQHHIIKNHNIDEIRDLLQQTFTISHEDDYSQTLIKTRYAIQTISNRLEQSKISFIFFFSHLQIDHSLGVKKISYINYLNQHADTCLDEVKHLAKYVQKFTEQCKTFIISYDKNGQEEKDYSLCDTDLMNQINIYVGNSRSTISRNYSYTQLATAFENVSALMMFKMYTLGIIIPILPVRQLDRHKYKQKQTQHVLHLECKDFKQLKTQPFFLKKQVLDTKTLKEKGVLLLSNKDMKNLQDKLGAFKVETKVNYFQLQGYQLCIAQAKVCALEIGIICRTVSKQIVSYKRRYEGGKSYLDMVFDKELFLQMRDKLEYNYQRSKEIFTEIQSIGTKGQGQFKAYQAYTELKTKIDSTRSILIHILKKQIDGSQIGKLSQVINFNSIKNSLRNKLLKRINANPFLLDQVYDTIYKIVDDGTIDFFKNEVDSGDLRYNLGNCILTDYNFVKAMKEYDALGVAFQIQRPMSAIADPGRLKIRQISTSLMRVSTFFQKFLYKIERTPKLVRQGWQVCIYCKHPYCIFKDQCKYLKGSITYNYVFQTENAYKQIKQKQSLSWNENPSMNNQKPFQHTLQQLFLCQTKEIDYLRWKGGLEKQNYQERCDYTNRVQKTQSVLGFMPLYLTQDHWRVAKLLMKPCLAFTATNQPLGYMFSQYETIPFMVLSSSIRKCKQIEYQLQQKFLNLQKINQKARDDKQLVGLKGSIKIIQKKLQRMRHMSEAIESTCRAILYELSSQKYENPLSLSVSKKYEQYKNPINRTIDVISNNSSFLSQIYLAFKNGFIKKPNQEQFDHFFVRLIQQQLRRQTDGWNEQETQDAFLYKLLNLDVEKIKKQQKTMVTIMDLQNFSQKFHKAKQGQSISNAMVQIQKQQLELMMTKGGKFNNNQRLLLIQYKRLYENRVLWMWYIRFLLYGEVERVAIHKWKCLGLKNSYMLFTLIIQNKKQRKNYKRREAINNGQYTDPFNHQQAKTYLQKQFSQLYTKVLKGMAQEVKFKHASNVAEVFAVTQDLQQAAGVLLNSHDLKPKIFLALMQCQVPLLADKLAMLLNGSYEGVHLFKGWKMSKLNMNKLRNRHKYQFSRYQYKF